MNVEAGLYKTLTYLGLVLLLGGTLFRRGVGPKLSAPLWALGLGALLVAGGSSLEILAALRPLLGSVAWADYTDYLLNSSQGQAVLLRLSLTAALLALEANATKAWWPSALLGAGLLAAVGATSHGRALGPLAYALDVLHLLAMVAWTGAVSFLAWQGVRRWRDPGSDLEPTVRRVSAVGLWSVVVLVASGSAAACLHVPAVGALSGTPYGLLLCAKVATFLVVLLFAARNRFALMRPGRQGALRLAVRAESVLLAAILAFSGLLTSSAPPEIPKTPATTPIQLRFGNVRVAGQLRTNATGGFTADLAVEGAAAPPRVTLVMTDHPMPDIPLRFSRRSGRFVASGQLWMSGTWVADVNVNGQTRRVPLLVR